jgi:arylsulfatase A-like enzyme
MQVAPERDLFFVRREGNLRYMGGCSWAMKRGPWKLLKNTPMEPWELYHLENDPLESRNLAQEEKETFANLAAAMRVHIQRGGSVLWQKTK